MADSEDKKPFADDSESTVRLDLNALKMEPESEEPLLDVESLLADDTDMTFSDPDAPLTPEPARQGSQADDLERQLDALANDVFNEETSFEKTFTAPRESSSFDSDKTVILGPESMVSEGQKPVSETPPPDETVSISPEPVQQEIQEELPVDQTVSTEAKQVLQPEERTSATSDAEHQATQRLEFPLPEFNEPLDEPHPDAEHPSWQYAQLEHPEEFPHPEKTDVSKAHATPEPKPAKKPKPAESAPKSPYPPHPPAQPSNTDQSSGGNKRLPMLLSLAVAILGLLAGAAGIWTARESDERAASLQRDLDAMQVHMIQLRKKSPDTGALEKRISELEAELAAAKEPEMAMPVEPARPQPAVASKAEKPAPVPAPAPATPKKADGDWVVYISSHASQSDAERELRRLTAAGVAAELRSAVVRGSTWHRVVAAGFTSKEGAADYAAEIKRDLNIRGAWIGKEK